PEAVAHDEEPAVEAEAESEGQEPVAAAVAKAAPGFSKLLDSIAGLTGFYGSQPVKVEPVIEQTPEPDEEPMAEEPMAEEPMAEEPITEEPVAEEPVAEVPLADEPAVEELVAEKAAPEPAEQPT